MNKKFLFVILLTALLLFVPLVSSVKPVTNVQTNNAGYQIFYPDFKIIPQEASFFLSLHVSNFSNGFPIQNSDVDCFLHLVNTSGYHTAEDILLEKEGTLEHIIFITGGNFSDIGTHAFFINCNDTNFGGQAKGTFDVTANGEYLTEGTSTIYLIVTFFAFLIFALLLGLFIYIDGNNPKDETGEYTGLNYKKYVKTSIFPLVYVSFIWFFNFIIGLSNNFLGLTIYSNTLEFIFLILIKLTYPILVVTGIVLLVLMVKDGNIKKEYKSLWNRS